MFPSRRTSIRLAALVVLASTSAACSGGDEAIPDDSPSTTTTPNKSASAPAAADSTTAETGDFFEDFSGNDSMSRFDFDIFHRDDLDRDPTDHWLGDHRITGPDDACTGPDEKRDITRGDRATGFNDDWIYRCAPGGDPEKAHLMTSIGDVSSYSIGAFSPSRSFTDVREVRWDINITELGTRQFPEVKLIPVDTFDFQNLPCGQEWLPCGTSSHGELGSVGTTFFNHELAINNGSSYETTEAWSSPWMYEGDPALTSIRIRRQHFFRDNGDGTLTIGIGSPGAGFSADSTCGGACREHNGFFEYTYPGSFPEGAVRVVFADHNYTPDKEITPISHTWHWDSITIIE